MNSTFSSQFRDMHRASTSICFIEGTDVFKFGAQAASHPPSGNLFGLSAKLS
jgi:hypothetical protein